MVVEKTVARKLQRATGAKYMVCLGVVRNCKAEAEHERRKLTRERELTEEERLALRDKAIDDRVLRGIQKEPKPGPGVEPFSDTWYRVASKYLTPEKA